MPIRAKVHIAVHLSQCIQEAGTSYRQIRDATGLSMSTLSRINQGRVRPSIETLELLCGFLKCTPGDLLKLDK